MEPGEVTSVKYEDGGVVCNVRAIRVNTQYKGIPLLKSHPGVIEVPEQGDTVMMEEVNSQRIIVGVMESGSGVPDQMKEGEMRIQLDDGTEVSFSRNSDDSYDVSVKASGDVRIEASGDVYVDGINFSNHTHDYEDDEIADTSDGTGTENTQTKTTQPPNN